MASCLLALYSDRLEGFEVGWKWDDSLKETNIANIYSNLILSGSDTFEKEGINIGLHFQTNYISIRIWSEIKKAE